MIELTDITLREFNGNYFSICEVMSEPGVADNWMIVSKAFVVTPTISCNYNLHFWYDGKVVIFETDHPLIAKAPTDDLEELRAWCRIHRWQDPSIGNRLLADPRSFEFWYRMFQTGVVGSDTLKQHDDDMNERFALAIEAERAQDRRDDKQMGREN